jgi:hypothetical protein
MRWDEVEALASRLDGVHLGTQNGLRVWRLHGRLVARQLGARSIAIRTEFDARSALVEQFPDMFWVPTRFRAHMMVAVNLAKATPVAVEQALDAAWWLQSRP